MRSKDPNAAAARNLMVSLPSVTVCTVSEGKQEITSTLISSAAKAAVRRIWVAPFRHLVRSEDSYLVDPASSHMLVSKIKPCMSKYKLIYCETANGSLNQLSFI